MANSWEISREEWQGRSIVTKSGAAIHTVGLGPVIDSALETRFIV
jgi:hypothetical protein